jgi:tripartite-type tricarboxylate transporter receptor subunit TctC
MIRSIATMLGLLGVLAAGAAQAQGSEYPAKPVKLVVPFPPGGALDIVGRLLAKELQEKWGQPVVVDNRGGASGNIGIDYTAKSAPDGYTFVIIAPPAVTTPHLGKVPFDITKDLAAVVQTATIDYLLAANPTLGVVTLAELIERAKTSPGKLNYASAGTGSGQHLQVELLRSAAGIALTHVPYKGSGPALQALMAGEVDLMFDTTISILPLVRAGKLQPLLVTGTKPLDAVPNVPAMGALYPEVNIDAWHGIVVPAGTPRPVIDKLAADIRAVVLSSAVSTRFRELGFTATGLQADAFAQIIRRDLERWGKVIRDNKIKAE